MTATFTDEQLTTALTSVFAELVDGATAGANYVLNGGDAGLLRSLDALSAAEASASAHGGATIAAHAEHLAYGLSLMNRWAEGEANPFSSADWSAAWKTSTVDDAQWRDIRARLQDQAHRWRRALGQPRAGGQMALNGMVGSVAHLAYHLGAIRQVAAAARGPKEPGGA